MEEKSPLLEKKDTYDINTITGQLVSQLIYCTSLLIDSKDPKHLEEIINLTRKYKNTIKSYRNNTKI